MCPPDVCAPAFMRYYLPFWCRSGFACGVFFNNRLFDIGYTAVVANACCGSREEGGARREGQRSLTYCCCARLHLMCFDVSCMDVSSFLRDGSGGSRKKRRGGGGWQGATLPQCAIASCVYASRRIILCTYYFYSIRVVSSPVCPKNGKKNTQRTDNSRASTITRVSDRER